MLSVDTNPRLAMEYYQKSECGCEFETVDTPNGGVGAITQLPVKSEFKLYIKACEKHRLDWKMRQLVHEIRTMFQNGLKAPEPDHR